MSVTWILVVLSVYSSFSESFSDDLTERMDYLEMHVNRESSKSRNDIMELRRTIRKMNTKSSAPGQNIVNQAVINTNIQKLESKQEEFIKEQLLRTAAISRAISDEKTVMRNMIKLIHENIRRNNASVVDSSLTMQAMEDRIMQKLRNETDKKASRVVQTEIDELTAKLEKLQTSLAAIQNGMINKKLTEPPCPEGWLRWENVCYFYEETEELSWHGASIRCHDFGGSLAEPDTEAAMRHLVGLVGSNVWIGGTDDENEDTWMWVSSNKKIDFFLWESGQPNSYGGEQDCMEVFKSQLNDEKCQQNNNYVCQKKANVGF